MINVDDRDWFNGAGAGSPGQEADTAVIAQEFWFLSAPAQAKFAHGQPHARVSW
jgi:hypothetical protein